MACNKDFHRTLLIFQPPRNFPFMEYRFPQLPKISIDSASQTSYLSCVASCFILASPVERFLGGYSKDA
jgi:hypothetical protein